MTKVRMFKKITVEDELRWPVDAEQVAAVVNRILVHIDSAEPRGAGRKEVHFVGSSARLDGYALKLRLELEVREDG